LRLEEQKVSPEAQSIPKRATMSPQTPSLIDLEALAGAGVEELVALLDRALVDAHIGELAVLAVLELEAEGDGGRVVVGLEDDLGLVLVKVEGDVPDLGGIGEVALDAVEEDLHAFVLVGGAHEDGDELLGDAALADGGHDLLDRGVALEGGFHEDIVEHRRGLDELLAVPLGVGLEVGGDLGVTEVHAAVAVEVDGLHLEEVDDALELVLETDGEGHEDRVEAELLGELGLDLEGVGARAVALVDEGDAGNMVALELAVDGDRLGLDAADRAEDEDSPVEDAEGTLDFDGEVDVAGGVDQVDRDILPGHVGRGGLDGDAALALEIHGIHGGADAILAVDLVDRVYLIAVEQDAFGKRRLAGIDVGADSDVPHLGNVGGHLSYYLSRRGFIGRGLCLSP